VGHRTTAKVDDWVRGNKLILNFGLVCVGRIVIDGSNSNEAVSNFIKQDKSCFEAALMSS
jgi:hypothetical protein